jgi:transposase
VYHQKEDRVDGHFFITVLWYHVLQAIRFRLKNKEIEMSWETIRELLSMQVKITTQMKTKKKKNALSLQKHKTNTFSEKNI